MLKAILRQAGLCLESVRGMCRSLMPSAPERLNDWEKRLDWENDNYGYAPCPLTLRRAHTLMGSYAV